MNDNRDNPKRHPAAISGTQLLKQCEMRRGRRSGPGGQHRNKVETAVEFCHRPTGIRAEASERRSQHANRKIAFRRLRVRLAIEVRSEMIIPYRPSSVWVQRSRENRLYLSRDHEDFPAVLAEALDVIATCDWDTRTAAHQLGINSSQLTKLLKSEPAALEKVNAERSARGLRRLQ